METSSGHGFGRIHLLVPFLATTSSVFLSSWLFLYLLPLLQVVDARFSSNPSTGWTLSDYDGNYNTSDDRNILPSFKFGNRVVCVNISSNFELLNDAEELYGRSTGLRSAHYNMPYTLYFGLYFVTPAENVCMRRINGSSVPGYYLSLVALNAFGRSEDLNEGMIVWTANPKKPVTRNACLHFNDSGLTLVDYHDGISSPEVVWQTHRNAANMSLVISFEGNVILFSNTTNPPNVPLWQSHQEPTDTWMVLQVLENHNTLNVSSTSNSANYTMAIQNGSLVLYANIGQLLHDDAESNSYGSPYWKLGSNYSTSENDLSFAAFCWDPRNQLRLYVGSNRSSSSEEDNFELGVVSPEFCSNIFINGSSSDTAMPITGLSKSSNATFATFLRLEADGDLHAYTVDNTTSDPSSNATWREFYSVFNDKPCDLPLICGFYGVCDPQNKSNYCSCNKSDFVDVSGSSLNHEDLELEMVSESGTKTLTGCMFKNDSVAKFWYNNGSSASGSDRNHSVEYMKMDKVDYFHLRLQFQQAYEEGDGPTAGDCLRQCDGDRNCTAAFWKENESKCYFVRGQLGSIKQQGDMEAYIKYVHFLPPKIRHGPHLSFLISPSAAALLLVAFIFLICLYKQRRDRRIREMQNERTLLLRLLDGNTTDRFTWKQMHEYTCGFSDLLGSGGFGRVFRGSLPDGTSIAVKQLDENGGHGQGNKEFMAEVSILSRIHHAHLVRLIGFCLEGVHRLLVYEYMENGSLDAWLFRSPDVPAVFMLQEAGGHHELQLDVKENRKRREVLPWKARLRIAIATAKGLAYLHEECEEKVIHMDLKPQNILLSHNFAAKISDFGMSRRTGREQSSVMTVMRGTPGYLAPEWLVDCAVTEKCDVYSFGIVLLEMVSGRKVKDVAALKQKMWMRPLRESVMLELLDDDLRSRNEVEEKEAVRMVEVALMCVRTDPTKRPSMSKVAAMLEWKEEVEEEDGEEEEDMENLQKKMVMYPSGMNRRMRMRVQQQQQYENHGRTSEELAATSGGGGSIWTSDMSMSLSMMMTGSSPSTSTSSSSYTKMMLMMMNKKKKMKIDEEQEKETLPFFKRDSQDK